VCAGGLVVLQADLLSEVVSRAFLAQARVAELAFPLTALLALALARGFLIWGSAAAGQQAASGVKAQLREALTRRLWDLGPLGLNSERTGEITHTVVQGVESLDAYVRQYLPQLALAVLVPLLIVGAVLRTDMVSGVVLLLTAPLIPVFMVLVGAHARAKTRRLWASLSRMSASFLDTLQGLTTLKLLGRSREHAGAVAEASEVFRKASMNVLGVALLSALVLESAATLSTAVVAVQVGLRLLHDQLPFREALFVLILAPEFFRPLRELGASFHAAVPGTAAADRIFSLLQDPPRTPKAAAVTGPFARTPEAPFELRFHEVCFDFGSGRRVLDGVCFTARAAGRLALVGPNGSGKSTIAGLALGFGQPSSGCIEINGIPLSRLDPRHWRRHVAYVPQRPHLFYGTVAENLRLARPDASDGELAAAARLAHAEGVFANLPQGFDTLLGEGGSRLSGGEAQRLALARAFLKDAPLLILDEATSHLDPELDRAIHDVLRRQAKGRTVIVISHRISESLDADSVVLLSAGRVVEQGAPRELARSGRLFPQLLAATGGAA
jgi:ATP-binding cassette subfamily C protein CydD